MRSKTSSVLLATNLLALVVAAVPEASFAQSGPPVAAYSFEGAGTTVTDVSDNGFNGTLANGPIWTTGQHGSALQFDATDDGNDDNDPRVVLGRVINIPDLPLTISAWVNPTAPDVRLFRITLHDLSRNPYVENDL